MSADAVGTPVWVWQPGESEPVRAATLAVAPGDGRWRFDEAYAAARRISPDPRQLHVTSRKKGIHLSQKDGLPGVVRDAMPSGYGADRLDAAAKRPLAPLEYLERGVPDSAGAIEVTDDIQKKLDWQPQPYSRLKEIIALMGGHEPASRAIRRLNDDAGTSAGGERPKVTIQDGGRMHLVKMQARGDLAFLPHKEFVVMSMASTLGIVTPAVRLERVGEHTVYLCERFDRGGDLSRPTRNLYASAHTVLRLDIDSTKGDPKRSYVAFADEMRVWCHGSPHLEQDLAELWRRMAYNALVGNVDDHPRNHGLLFVGGHWRLAPAFDITPLGTAADVLSMATGADGSAAVSAQRLVAGALRFDVSAEEAAGWLREASIRIASEWEGAMRASGVSDAEISAMAPAFFFAAHLAADQTEIEFACAAAATARRRVRRAAANRDIG